MNTPLAAAAGLATALSLAHSVLGELLLLRHFSKLEGLSPITSFVLVPLGAFPKSADLSKSTIRMSWHALTAFGLAAAASFAVNASRPLDDGAVMSIRILSAALLACGLLFLVGTRMRHPGGYAFLILAALSWLGGSVANPI